MDREGQKRTQKQVTKKTTKKSPRRGAGKFKDNVTNKLANKFTNRAEDKTGARTNKFSRTDSPSRTESSSRPHGPATSRPTRPKPHLAQPSAHSSHSVHSIMNELSDDAPRAFTKDSVRYVEVIGGYEDQRIDNFLIRELKGVPLAHIYRVIRKGEVRVNKKRVKQTHKLELGDMVRIPPMSTGPKSIPPDPARFQYLKDRIVYEDETIFILNKPHGLAVHEGSNIQSGLIEALRVVFPEHKQLELVHRLDKETSGLIIIAKNRSVMKQLNEMLRERQIKKTYHAVVVGRWPKGLNKVDLPLEGDKESVTTFQVLENREKTTLIEAHPLTGRTHQIRLHCQASGHSIVGDSLYGDKNFEFLNDSPRMYLHAAQLKFIHPKTGDMVHVKAESGF